MISQNKILAAIAAIMLTESLVEAQRRNRRDRDGGDGGRDGGDGGNNGPQNPADIGYFATQLYQNQSAAAQLNDLWTQCLAEESDVPADENYNLDDFFRSNMGTSFNRQADEMPNNRIKFNHAQGVVGRIVWEDLGNHPYTGLYDGNSEGLLRFSEGNFLLPEASGLTPTLAMKFNRDGMRSTNHLANVNFEPTTSWNFFANPFLTRVPFFESECGQDSVQKKFLEVTSRPQSLGLSDFSEFNVDGSQVADIEFPFDLSFVPTPEMRERFSEWDSTRPVDADGNEVFWYNQLKEIEEGTILLEVIATSHPDDPRRFPEATVEHIANIRLNSSLITSIFGDERLFFKHENMNNDFQAEPEWARYVDNLPRGPGDVWGNTPIPAYPNDPVDQKAWVRGQMAEFGCPFAWLFGNTVTPIYDEE